MHKNLQSRTNNHLMIAEGATQLVPSTFKEINVA